jgi:hypothetical protein
MAVSEYVLFQPGFVAADKLSIAGDIAAQLALLTLQTPDGMPADGAGLGHGLGLQIEEAGRPVMRPTRLKGV